MKAKHNGNTHTQKRTHSFKHSVSCRDKVYAKHISLRANTNLLYYIIWRSLNNGCNHFGMVLSWMIILLKYKNNFDINLCIILCAMMNIQYGIVLLHKLRFANIYNRRNNNRYETLQTFTWTLIYSKVDKTPIGRLCWLHVDIRTMVNCL